ncbi:MAG: EamA family transporter [Alphaproteobacteria bacterium]|nr:EamA family transporter [Alphaproteobacteria bacterium]
MLASAASFTIMTTLIKYLGDGYPAALQTFYRQAAGMVVLAPIILRDPRGAFRTSRLDIMLFRSALGTIGMILAFYAYQELPLADANALSFTRTLWIVPLAALWLRESVGPRRIVATCVGFAGVLLMLQPQNGFAVGWPAAAALGSAALFALTVTGMKLLTRDHSATTLLVWSAVLGFVFSLPPALFVWRWPTPPDLALLGLMGALGVCTQFFYIRGMALGDAAAMAPIDYTRLVMALGIGFLLFQETPNLVTLAGAGIVIASTLYITWREAQLVKPPPRDRPE